jgi:cyclic pyranopterin phosphate synthase
MDHNIETPANIPLDKFVEVLNGNHLKPLPKLRLTISDKCQLKCVFCGGDDYDMENFQPKTMCGKLDTIALSKFIRLYVKHGGVQVQFTGGEPLVRKEICELIKIVVDNGGIPEINTNGIGLSERKAKELKEAGLDTIKVSMPTFDREEFKLITRVDALPKVFRNIKSALDILNVRITMVPLKKSLGTFFDSLDLCRNKLGVKQVTLLELLYYPNISSESKRFFANQHVDLLSELAPRIEEYLGTKFKQYCYLTQIENSLYYIDSPHDHFKVFIKQANQTLRAPECYKCNHFCQEGLYEMRLSTGGWLSMCNIPNELGVDITKQANEQKIINQFTKFKKMFSNTKVSSFKEFAEHHDLYSYIDESYILT